MFRIHLATAAFAAAVAIMPAQAQEHVPAALDNLKPHEVVEAIKSEATTLGLAPDQVRRLDSLHVAVRDERHQWVATSGNKAHAMLKMKPMISAERAYRDAVAILTPDQRVTLARALADTGYVPVVPSLATQVPPSLGGLKPHEIPQVFVAERKQLGLSDAQVTQLRALHVAVRDEAHRYVQRQHGAKGHPHMMMEPMISKQRAYNDALSYLTAEQQQAADKLFRGSTFKPRLGTATT
jgi:predicted RNA binding protein with dsRBD fold (UPF0201 family)